MIPAELSKQIQNFLLHRRRCVDSGSVEITDIDITQLREIVDSLILAKCEPSCNGDYPIGYEITNLNEFEEPDYLSIPHHYAPKRKADLEEVYSRLKYNLEKAIRDFDIFIKTKDVKIKSKNER